MRGVALVNWHYFDRRWSWQWDWLKDDVGSQFMLLLPDSKWHSFQKEECGMLIQRDMTLLQDLREFLFGIYKQGIKIKFFTLCGIESTNPSEADRFNFLQEAIFGFPFCENWFHQVHFEVKPSKTLYTPPQGFKAPIRCRRIPVSVYSEMRAVKHHIFQFKLVENDTQFKSLADGH